MVGLPVLDAHAPPLRVMALHALAYYPRLFYLDEVEGSRVADAAVFAGREADVGDEGKPVSNQFSVAPK
jgi:CRISP-associated protein Cas1